MRLFYSLSTLLLVAACSTVEQSQKSSEPVTYIRKNIYSPEAAADIEAMRVANEKMRELDCSNPWSWYYQGAIHLVPDSVPGNQLCPQFVNKDDILPGWAGCTHDAEEVSVPHFLTWHRMYIWYYEKIVRELSGKEDFALPYWEYTNANYRVMPEAFRDETSSLYTASRLDSLNEGFPITEAYNLHFNMANVYENTSYAQFNIDLDNTPHGPMHGYLGGGKFPQVDEDGNEIPPRIYNEVFQADSVGLMASLATAGFDPIFFVHHANIDYLWEIWNQSDNGTAPMRDSLNAVEWAYTFFDENGDRVDYTVDQMLDTIYSLDYKYDVLDEMTQAQVVAEVTPDVQVWYQEFGDDLNKDSNSFEITEGRAENAFTKLNELAEGERLIMHVKVSYDAQPRSTYYVFLNLEEETEEEKLVRHTGGMSFFGAGEHLTHMSMPRMTKTFQYDVTDELLALEAGSLKINVREIGSKLDETLRFESASLYVKTQ